MKFFFDNNLSPHLAHGIRELSATAADVERVVHLTDMFERTAPDVTWLGTLGEDGPWCIISIDRFNKNHDAERAVIRKMGHTVFVLDQQWSSQQYWAKAERLVKWWPQILNQARLATGLALRVPWHHTSTAKFSAIKL